MKTTETKHGTAHRIEGRADVLEAAEKAREEGSILIRNGGDADVEDMLRRQGWSGAETGFIAPGLARVYAGDRDPVNTGGSWERRHQASQRLEGGAS